MAKLEYKDLNNNTHTRIQDDITKSGALGFKNIKEINDANQKGVDKSKLSEGYKNFISSIEARKARTSAFDPNEHLQQDVKSSLYGSGNNFGESTYDKGIVNENEFNNYLQDIRADNQSGVTKIAAGIAKGAVLAGTTFVDSILGTIAGVGNVITQAAQGNINSGWDVGKAFIDNPFSAMMAQINKDIEKFLPNYYTETEQTAPWYTQILTANFIGDKFLKNLGFAIGAAYGGKFTAGMLSKVMKMGKIRDAFKGAVQTATGKTLEESSKIAKAYLTGDAVMDGVKITEDLAKAAKQMKKATETIKNVGAVAAAMGEGRIEAISGSHDWVDAETTKVKQHESAQLDDLNKQLMSDHPEWFSLDEDGNPVLTDPTGKAVYENAASEIRQKTELALAQVNEKGARMANIIFALNVPLLAGSNIYQHGKFIAGGFKTGRLGENLTKGSIKEGFTRNLAPQRKALVKAVGSPFMEAQEEMSQQWIQEIPGAKYGSDINSFFKAKVDEDASLEAESWIKAIGTGFLKSYGDVTQWEQGFIGMFTGALGSPRIRFKRNEEGKIRGLSLSNDGELYSGIKEYSRLKKESAEIVERLNSVGFKDRYEGIVRHKKLENDMQKAIKDGKAFDYKNAETSQIVSDIIALEKAGQTQEFMDYIDAMGDTSNLTEEQIQDIRMNAQRANNETDVSIFDSMSDEEVKEHIKSQAETIKSVATNYLNISRDLKTLYGEDINSDTLEEMSWMMTQINDWESRGKDVYDKIKDKVFSKITELKSKYGDSKQVQNLEAILNNYEDFKKAFLQQDSNLIDDINKIIAEENTPLAEQNKKIAQRINRLTRQITTPTSLKNVKNQVRERVAKRIEQAKKETPLVAPTNGEMPAGGQVGTTQRLSIDKEHTTAYLAEQGEIKEHTKNSTFSDTFKSLESALQKRAELQDMRQNYSEDIEYEMALNDSDIDSMTPEEASEYHKELLKRKQKIKDQKSSLALLIQAYNDNVNDSVDPLEAANLTNDFYDLIKIISARTKFITTYEALSKNPAMFTEANVKVLEESKKRMLDKEARDLFEEVKEYKSFDDIKELKESVSPEMFSRILDLVEEEGDDDLKLLFNRFRGIQELKEDIAEALVVFADEEHIKEADQFIHAAIDNAKNRKSAINEIEEIIEDDSSPEEIRALIAKIMEKYEEIRSSKEATRKDIRKPKKESKQQGGKAKKKSQSSSNNTNSNNDSTNNNTSNNTQNNNATDSDKAPLTTRAKGSIIPDVQPGAKPDDSSQTKAAAPSVVPPARHIAELNNSMSEEQKAQYGDIYEYLLDNGISTTELGNTEALTLSLIGSQNEEEQKKGLEQLAKDVEKTSPLYKYAEQFVKDGEEARKATKANAAARAAAQNTTKKAPTYSKKGSKKTLRLTDEKGNIVYAHNNESEYVELLSDDDLEGILTGKYWPEGADDEVYDRILELAKKEKAYRQETYGNENTENYENNDDPTNEYDDSTVRSFQVTQYRIDELKKQHKAIPYNSLMAKALQELGVFDFVDKGYLGRILAKNEDLPIRYVFSNNPVLKGIPLLAIQVTDEVDKLAHSALSNIITIEGEGSFQIIGTLAYNKSKESKDSYNKMVELLKEELSDDEGNLDKDFKVSSKYSNKIKHIYSGRFVTSTETIEEKERPISAITKTDFIPIGIYVNPTIGLKTFGIPSDSVVLPNSFNTNPREGSVWWMIRAGDGKYYPLRMNVARLHEYDFNKSTEITKEVKRLLTIIADPTKSDHKRTLAKYALRDIVHFPIDNNIEFFENTVSIKGHKNNIGENALTVEEKVDAILKEMQDPALNLRFNIAASKLNDSSYITSLISSDILSTNLAMTQFVGASFDLYNVNDNGEIIEDNSNNESKTGHTGNRSINSSKSYTSIYLGGEQFKIDSEGTIYRASTGLPLKPSSSEDSIAIERVLAKASVDRGEVAPYKNSKLYIVPLNGLEKIGFEGDNVYLSSDEIDNAMKRIDNLEVSSTAKITALESLNKALEEEEGAPAMQPATRNKIEDGTPTPEDDDSEDPLMQPATRNKINDDNDDEAPSTKYKVGDKVKDTKTNKVYDIVGITEDGKNYKIKPVLGGLTIRKPISTVEGAGFTAEISTKSAEESKPKAKEESKHAPIISDTKSGQSLAEATNKEKISMNDLIIKYIDAILDIKDATTGNYAFDTVEDILKFMEERPKTYPPINSMLTEQQALGVIENLKNLCG